MLWLRKKRKLPNKQNKFSKIAEAIIKVNRGIIVEIIIISLKQTRFLMPFANPSSPRNNRRILASLSPCLKHPSGKIRIKRFFLSVLETDSSSCSNSESTSSESIPWSRLRSDKRCFRKRTRRN